jgi:D-tyrosyl-tRNA(Tyr) deacylase
VKVVIQRVTGASVSVNDEIIGKIGHGLCVFVGVASGDTDEDIKYLVDKIITLRIFEDAEGKFNLSALDVKGELLLVSQFTLLASTRKGRRPGFTHAAPPELASVRAFCGYCQSRRIKSGNRKISGAYGCGAA